MPKTRIIRPDAKGPIILEPYTEIPDREKWLFHNPSALSTVREGLKQSARGEARRHGSFAKFANDEID